MTYKEYRQKYKTPSTGQKMTYKQYRQTYKNDSSPLSFDLDTKPSTDWIRPKNTHPTEYNVGEKDIAILEKDLGSFAQLTDWYKTFVNNGGDPYATAVQKNEQLKEYRRLTGMYGNVSQLADTIAQRKSRQAQEQNQKVFDSDMKKIDAMTEQDKADLQTYGSAFLDNLAIVGNAIATGLGYGAPDVVLVPGQGIVSVSPQMKAAEAQKRLLDKGYTNADIRELAETYSRKQNAEAAQQFNQAATESVQKSTGSAIGANVARVPLKFAGGITSGVDYAIEELKQLLGQGDSRYATLDPNLPGSFLDQYSDTVVQETKKKIEDGDGLLGNKVGSTLYGAAVSLVDNAVRFAAAGGGSLGSAATKALSLSNAGLSAFGSSVRGASENGGTASQAALKGLVDAGSEVLTEMLPLENLLNIKSSDAKTVSQMLKGAIKQAGVETLGEEINYGVGLLTDAIIMGDKSDAARQKRKLMEEDGLSEKEANREVLKSIIFNGITLAAESMLSGFGQGTIEGGKNLVVQKITQPQQQQQEDTAPTAPQQAEKTQQSQQTPQAAQEQTPAQKGAAQLQSLIEDTQRRVAAQSPLGKAVEAYERTGTLTNSQAESVLNDPQATQDLAAKTGIEIAGTKAQMRSQVKQAVSVLASQQVNNSLDTSREAAYDGVNTNIVQGGTEHGLREYDRGAGAGDPASGLAGVQRSNGNEIARGQEHGGVALDTGILRVSESLQNARNKRGVSGYDLYDTTSSPSDYEQALLAGRNSDVKNGWCVTPKTAGEFAEHGIKTVMNANKTVGFGVAPDGDIVAVFKNKNGGPKKALDTAMPAAIEMGGDRLDCYGEGLVSVYEDYGFVPVARVEFNPAYANEGWTPDKGTPYIYFMMHNGDSAAEVTQKMHAYDRTPQQQLDALPTYGKDDYDAAMQYRNDLIEQRKISGTQNKAVGAAEAGFTGYAGQYDQLLSDDNVQPQRPGAVRDLEVPKKDAFGRDVSKFASNAAASKVTPETFIPTFQELGVIGALGKDTKTQAETLENAENWIRDKGTTQARAQILSEAFDGKVSDNAIAAAFIEYTRSAGNISVESQNDAAEMFVALEEMATNSGRNLNLFKLFQRMTPEGQTMAVEKSVQKYVEKLNKGRSKKNQATVTIPQQLLDDYKEAARAAIGENATQEQIDAKDAAVDAIYMAAASQIKSTLKEKWDGVRHFSMLGNFKTQVRNEGGNIAMRPFVTAKRAVGAALEKAMKVPQEQRTKAVLGLGEDAKALLALAKADAQTQDASDRMSRNVKTGDQARTAIDEYRKTFDYTAQNDTSNTPDFIKKVRQAANTAMEAGSKGVSNFMENRDMFYKRWEYRVSLASFIKARGYTAQQWQQGQIPANVMEEGRSYAAQEAMKATFNDRNTLTEALGKLRYHGDNPWKKAASIAGEGLLPYLSTPANVALRAKDYSAAGFIQGVAETATKVKRGDMTAAEAIDHMASGLTGIGVNLLGYALASGILGIRLVGAQDDEDKERTGHQAYSLEIDDKSYTIDWAAPVNIPLFVGANLYKVHEEMGTDDVSAWAKFATVAASTFEPMLELSVLSSVADLFDTARTARDGTAMYSIAASIATSYLTQGLPTVFSQFDQLGGKTRQMVYATSEDPTERAVQKLIGKVTQRLPGDAYQTDYVDAWGRTSETKWFESLLSPSYAKAINETKADQEIMRLNKALDVNVSPKTPDYTVTIDGKKTRLTGEQWSELAKAKGQKAYTIVDKMIRTGEYQKLNDSEKAAAIEQAYSYASEYAKSKVLDGYEISTQWMRGIDGNEADAIVKRALQESTGLTQARYERAVEAGVSIDNMRQVTTQVNKRLEGTKNKTAYDSYRAVIELVDEKDRDMWLEIYGMSESRIEEMHNANAHGIDSSAYLDYLQADSKLDSAFTKITTAWKEGEEADLEPLAQAYDAFEDLPPKTKAYFQEQMGGRIGAFANAMDAGISESTFINLWKQYYDLGKTGSSSGANANEWANILDNAKDAGQITARQRNVLWSDLGFYAQIRQDAAKYHDMTKEGLKPDKARYVADLMSGVDTLAKKLETISGASLTDAEKEQAARAYLTTDTQEEKLDKILAMGMDMDTYAQLYGGYSEAEGRKSLSVESFMDMGLRRSEAVTVWQIFAGKK